MAEGGLPNAGTGGEWLCHIQGMDTEVDLTTVDRDVLIAIIAELQAVIERLQRTDCRTGGHRRNRATRSECPASRRNRPGSPQLQQGPRKQRRHGFARPRMPPTHRVEHVMENCPDCGAHLSGGWYPPHSGSHRAAGGFRRKSPSTSTLLGLARRADGAAHLRRNWTAWFWASSASASTCSA